MPRKSTEARRQYVKDTADHRRDYERTRYSADPEFRRKKLERQRKRRERLRNDPAHIATNAASQARYYLREKERLTKMATENAQLKRTVDALQKQVAQLEQRIRYGHTGRLTIVGGL